MGSDAGGDVEARLRLSQLVEFGQKMAESLPEHMKDALCTPVGEPNEPLVTDRPNAKKSPETWLLENRWILNRFLDMEDWQVRSPSIYEVQVVLETFNAKLKELDDEYVVQVSRIRALWSKMRKMWSNTPGKSRHYHIQAPPEGRPVATPVVDCMRVRNRSSPSGKEVSKSRSRSPRSLLESSEDSDEEAAAGCNRKKSRSDRVQPLEASDEEAAMVCNRNLKRHPSSEEESSDSETMVSAGMLRNSMNGESIFNFMSGSKPVADGEKPAAADDEPSDRFEQWDPDADDAEKEHFTAESFDWDAILKEHPEYAISEARFDEAVKNIWADPPKPVPVAGDDKPKKTAKKKITKSRRRQLLLQNLKTKAEPDDSKNPKASPSKPDKSDIPEKSGTSAKKPSPSKPGTKPATAGGFSAFWFNHMQYLMVLVVWGVVERMMASRGDVEPLGELMQSFLPEYHAMIKGLPRELQPTSVVHGQHSYTVLLGEKFEILTVCKLHRLLDNKYKCEILLRQKALKPKGVDQEHGRSISLRIGVKEAWEQLNHALGRVVSK
ncbi:unnamed protein product [Symbiodinium sp. CCMP2456]|nr:unnamed protein product [Symbiodinium sp. CCMP2456]